MVQNYWNIKYRARSGKKEDGSGRQGLGHRGNFRS